MGPDLPSRFVFCCSCGENTGFKSFNLFLAGLGLHCWGRAFSSCGEQELFFFVVHRLLIVVASLVHHGL